MGEVLKPESVQDRVKLSAAHLKAALTWARADLKFWGFSRGGVVAIVALAIQFELFGIKFDVSLLIGPTAGMAAYLISYAACVVIEALFVYPALEVERLRKVVSELERKPYSEADEMFIRGLLNSLNATEAAVLGAVLFRGELNTFQLVAELPNLGSTDGAASSLAFRGLFSPAETRQYGLKIWRVNPKYEAVLMDLIEPPVPKVGE